MKWNPCLALLLLTLFSCSEMKIKEQVIRAPKVNLISDQEIIQHDYRPALLEYSNKEESFSISCKVKRRGGLSIRYPKYSYELDFEEDISLANLKADDDWILNANYIDKTFLRHIISYELFMAMGSNNIASNCGYLNVELKGNYNGLYVLMEKLDRSTLRIDKNDDSAVIFKEPHLFRISYTDVQAQDPANFHQQIYPKIEVEDKTDVVEELRTFLLSSSDSTFTNEFNSFFDLQNLLDWHLLLLISNNSDGILKNFYLYKQNDTTPFRIAPWDYDHSFGRDGDNELNLDERPLDLNRSILFKRLLEMDWYLLLLKSKWEALNNDGLFTIKDLKNRFQEKADLIKSLVEKNHSLWPLDGIYYYDDNDFEKEIEIIHQFIELRHQRLSDYFENL